MLCCFFTEMCLKSNFPKISALIVRNGLSGYRLYFLSFARSKEFDQAKLQIGDRIEYSNLNTDTLEIDNATAKVLVVRDAMVKGVKISYYTIKCGLKRAAGYQLSHRQRILHGLRG